MLKVNTPIPLYIQLADKLKRKIEQEFYEINSKIPSEKELMSTYKVGRATVREAIKILVSEGYLEKKQGLGTFVRIKNKNLGFEPLISLAYLFDGRGYHYFNKVIKEEIINISKNNDFRWKLNKSFYIKRNRYVDNKMIAIEEFYFNPEFKNISKGYDFEESVGKLMVEILDLAIEKISQDIMIKENSDNYKKILNIKSDEKILVLNRWIYLKNSIEPYQYYKLVIPYNLTSSPFVNI